MRGLLRLLATALGLALAAPAAQAAGGLAATNSFLPATLTVKQSSRLRVTFVNNEAFAATGAALTNVLPDTVFVAASPGIATTCAGASVSTANTAQRGSVTITGATIPARSGTVAGSCTVDVTVFAARRGSYTNTLAAGALSATQDGQPVSSDQAASATLFATVLSLTGSMGGLTDVQGNEQVSRTIVLTNPNPVSMTGTAFTMNMSANGNHLAIFGQPTGNTCGGSAVVTSTPNTDAVFGPTSILTLTNGTVPASGSCTIFFRFQPSRDPALSYYDPQRVADIPANTVTTNEGATNALIFASVRAVTGVRVTPLFNGLATASVAPDTEAQLTLRFENFNRLAVTNFSLTNALPAGLTLLAPAVSNSCGGSVSVVPGDGGSVSLTGASLASIPAIAASNVQSTSCSVVVRVKPTALTPASHVSTVAAGSLAGFQFDASSATLRVVDLPGPLDGSLAVTASLPSALLYPGDSSTLTFTFQNTTATPLTNVGLSSDLAVDFVDRLATGRPPYPHIRLGGAGLLSQTCGASVSAVPGTTFLDISGIALAANASCTVSVRIALASDAPQKFGQIFAALSIPKGQVRFDTGGQTSLRPAADVTYNVLILSGLSLAKSFTPAQVQPNGITRLRLLISRTTQAASATSGLAVVDTLPAGLVVAPVPGVVSECGGTVTAVPGTGEVSLTGGSLGPPVAGTTASCSVYVNIQAPNSEGTDTNSVPAASADPARGLRGTDLGQPPGRNGMMTSAASSAQLRRVAAFLSVNTEFLTPAITTGQPSRVRIVLMNTETGSVALTGAALTDSFSGTPLQLAASPNPAFTTTAGAYNTGGCIGGSFATTPGPGGSITLSGAQISANTICYVEFDVTTAAVGAVQNQIVAGAVTSDQGVSNAQPASAMLTADQGLTPSIGFQPAVLQLNTTGTVFVDITNSTATPLTGSAAPALLTQAMPAGVSLVAGSATTTCAGASASISGSSVVLTGGTYPANSTCRLSAQVTSATAGRYTATVAASALKTVETTTNPQAATGTVAVVAPPAISFTFSPTTIAYGGVSTITYTVANPNSAVIQPAGLSGAAFGNTLTNMVVASPPDFGGTCASATVGAVPGGSTISVSGIRLSAAASCTVSVKVTSTVPGVRPNQASGVTTNETPVAGAASNTANLTVQAALPVTLSKSFAAASIPARTGTRLQLTLTNPNAFSVSIGTPGLSDTFPTLPGAMTVASVPNAFNTCDGLLQDLSGGTVSAGDTGIVLTGGILPANDSCLVAVDITPTRAGSYTNTTSALITDLGTTAAASAPLTALPIALPIFATASAWGPFVSAPGGATAPVTADDLLDGGTPVPGPAGTVVLTEVTPAGDPKITLDPATGIITAAPGAAAGSYGVTYRICQADFPANCAEATETVTISANAIAAGAEADRAVTASALPVAAGTVLSAANDTVNGAAATVGAGGTVLLSTVAGANTSAELSLEAATGALTLAGGTGAGTYRLEYRLCDATAPTNCASAIETVVVSVPPISASPEGFAPFDTDGGTTTSVLVSDRLAGAPATLATVAITVLGSSSPAITLMPGTGLITLLPGQPSGSYTVSYRICQIAVPSNCATTTETVVQGLFGQIGASTTATGPDGTASAAPGQTVTFTFKVDNALNMSISGLRLQTDLTTAAGAPVAFGSGPTFVSSSAGSPEGSLLPGETAIYSGTALMTAETAGAGGFVTTVTVQAEAPGGAGLPPIVVSATATATVEPVALPLSQALALEVTTPRGIVPRGAAVPYTLILSNADATVPAAAVLQDVLPSGFLYVPGSARIGGAPVAVTVQGGVVTWPAVQVPPQGQVIATFAARVPTGVPAGEHVNRARALRVAQPGRSAAQAMATVAGPGAGGAVAAATVSAEGAATVRILPEPVFECGDVIGKVFDDADSNGLPGDGEPGLPAVRIAGVDGTVITTDAFGRFHVPCAMLPQGQGTNFILKLDAGSLPEGYRLTTVNPRVVRLTPGKMSDLSFGAARLQVVRLDLNARAFVQGVGGPALSPALEAGITGLPPQIADAPVVLSLAFHLPAGAGPAEVAQARASLRQAERQIRRVWAQAGHRVPAIETLVLRTGD